MNNLKSIFSLIILTFLCLTITACKSPQQRAVDSYEKTFDRQMKKAEKETDRLMQKYEKEADRMMNKYGY